jgi:hypothetical protein
MTQKQSNHLTFLESAYIDAVKRGNTRKIVRFGNLISGQEKPFKKDGLRHVRFHGCKYRIDLLIESVLKFEQENAI